MGTRAVVGMGNLETGWTATLVGYDGDPETLGPKLLDVLLDHEGDLSGAWHFISSPTRGWRRAFTQPYEADWDHGFEKHGPGPLIRHTDPFVTGDYGDGAVHLDGPEYWYLLDPQSRSLTVYAAPGRLEPSPPELLHVARFDAAGAAHYDAPPPSPLDWTNRRATHGSDAPGDTAVSSMRLLDEALPLSGEHFTLALIIDKVGGLTPRGLVVPLVAFASYERAISEQIDAVTQHEQFLLLRWRMLCDRSRCEHALRAALAAISRHVEAGETMDLDDADAVFSCLFPMDLLALDIDAETLARGVADRVAAAFDAVS